MDWPHLVEQLRDFIEHEVGHPAYLVGHSLGGYLSMMAASRHPHLAQGVVVMDSPVLHGWKNAGIGLAKKLGTLDRVVTPARIAAQRTQEWSSLQVAHEHFAAKPKFAAFHPRILNDYLAHGTHAQRGSETRRLSFQRDIESAIYATMPHNLLPAFRRHPHQCPVAFIGGTRSRETRKVGIEGIKQIVHGRMSWIEGTHLYPFEVPEQTAAEVLHWLREFQHLQRPPVPAPSVPAPA
jgi:pimeloyl-ACP methyl ester carboxylesterase